MINLHSSHGDSELVIIIRNPELYTDLGTGGNFFRYELKKKTKLSLVWHNFLLGQLKETSVVHLSHKYLTITDRNLWRVTIAQILKGHDA